MRALISGVRMARRIAATSSARAVSAGEIEPGASIRSEAELESWIRRRAQSFFHLAGTCRMGQDALAVVDPQLRVHGVEGLRVADASVMPLLVRGHTHAAAVMIGERAADLIRWTPTDQRRLTSCMSSSAASSS
jgi:choline dehydrogenase